MANWMHISSFWSEMHLIHSALISKISLKDIAWIWLLHFYVSYPKNFDIQETSQQNTCVHLGIIVVVRKGLSDSSPHSNISFPIILPWVDVWPLKIHCSAGHQWGNPMWYWYHPTFVLPMCAYSDAFNEPFRGGRTTWQALCGQQIMASFCFCIRESITMRNPKLEGNSEGCSIT